MSAVRVVGADAPMIAKFPVDSSLEFIRKSREICSNITEDGFVELCKCIQENVAKNIDTVQKFEETCEGILSILYFSHQFPSQLDLVQKCNQYFAEKCFDCSSEELNEKVFETNKCYQTSLLACIILLYNHYNRKINKNCLTFISQWKEPNLKAPQWLIDALDCPNNTYKALQLLLHKSLALDYDSDEFQLLSPYMKGIADFFTACSHLNHGRYPETIMVISSIESTNCSKFLSSWISILWALCLVFMKKNQSALVKCKDAVNHSSYCYYGLYLSSRIFHTLNLPEAQLNCLKLLAKVDVSTIPRDFGLQNMLLRFHLSNDDNLTYKSKWILATFCMYNERWDEARDVWYDVMTSQLTPPKSTSLGGILPPSDCIPSVPLNKDFAALGYAISLLSLGQSPESMEKMKDIVEGKGPLVNESDFDELNVCMILLRLFVARSLYGSNQVKKALNECTRLLTDIESLPIKEDVWRSLNLVSKCYLYKLLRCLYNHSSIKQSQNSRHFWRLSEQNLVLLQKIPSKDSKKEEVASVYIQCVKTFVMSQISGLK